MEESTKRRIESTATEEEEYSSTKACKIPKWDAPPPLPEGWWAEWCDDAVCFVLPISGEEGLGIFAINPLDASVYHVVDFRNGGPGVASNAACAVLGSRVYVVLDTGSMWFCDIDGPSALEWKKGKNLNGISNGNPNTKLFNSPTMFTLNDDLYVVDLVITYDDEPEHKFQKHFKNGWVSLRAPPPIRPSNYDPPSEYRRDFLGVVYNESSAIFHVCTTHRHLPFPGSKVSCSCGVFHEHRLMCYKPDRGHGKWTRIGGYRDKITPWQNPLLLLMPPEKICNFGLYRPTKPFIDLDELDDGLRVRIWRLLHVTGRIYCAVASPPPATSEPADFVVYSFGVVDHEVPEELKSDNVERVFMTARLISCTNQRFSGYSFPKKPTQEDHEFSLQNHNQELSYPLCGQHSQYPCAS